MSTRSYQHKTSLRASSNGHARLTGSGIALCLLMQCTCDCRTLASFLHDGFIPAEHHSSNTPRSTESLETLVQSLKVTRGYKLCDFRETGDACTLCDAQRQLKRDGERACTCSERKASSAVPCTNLPSVEVERAGERGGGALRALYAAHTRATAAARAHPAPPDTTLDTQLKHGSETWGGAGQRVGYTKIGPRASPNRITQNHG
jgi:hypothetical protein